MSHSPLPGLCPRPPFFAPTCYRLVRGDLLQQIAAATFLPQSLSVVYLHLVFSTKERRPFLRDRSQRLALHAYLGRISKTLDCPDRRRR